VTVAKSRDEPASTGPLKIETEKDLRAQMRQICRRLDANPDLSRLLLINPVLVMEDVGVQLSDKMRTHVMNALRFPPKRLARIAELETKIAEHCATLGVANPLSSAAPRKAAARPAGDAVAAPADPGVAATEVATSAAGPQDAALAESLAEHARLRQGAMAFFPREIYEQFKRGEKKHRWIKAIRFNV
jgi:hypothetical protein